MIHCRQKLAGSRRCIRNKCEFSSFCWQHQLGGRSMYHDTINDKTYSGAGLLLIEDCWYQGEIVPCLILFYELYKKEYEELGGGHETTHRNIITTSIVEAQEESANLINISNPNILQHFIDKEPQPRSKPGVFYRMYILKVAGFSATKFMDNVKTIKNNVKTHGQHKGWLEMTKVVRVPLTEFIKKTKNDRVKTIEGKMIDLGRIRMFNDPESITIINYVATNTDTIPLIAKKYQGSEPILQNTTTYEL